MTDFSSHCEKGAVLRKGVPSVYLIYSLFPKHHVNSWFIHEKDTEP